jgi:hypothetical protein
MLIIENILLLRGVVEPWIQIYFSFYLSETSLRCPDSTFKATYNSQWFYYRHSVFASSSRISKRNGEIEVAQLEIYFDVDFGLCILKQIYGINVLH